MQEPSMEQIFGSYMAWKLKEKTWVISFMNGTEYMYLLEGDERALLVDTGYGVGNLRAFVEKLTDKPIDVINTHFHPDHAAGNGEFERAYVSTGWKNDEPSLYGGATPFDLAKLPYPDYEKIEIGDCEIELGNRTIEVIQAAPAHCDSSLFLLDRTYRLFLCGDDLESAQVIMCDNSGNPDVHYDVRERLDNLRANTLRMKELSDAYDYLLPNHNGTPISKEYLDDYIGLVDHIYAGDALIEDKLNHPYIEMDPKASTLCRVRYRGASIFIVKELVMSVYGSKREG